LLWAGWAAVLSLLAAAEPPSLARRPGQDSSITRAVFAEGRLWLRSDAGVLFSVAPGEPRAREERVPAPPRDLCAHGDRLFAVAWDQRKWMILRHQDDAWTTEATFDAMEALLGVSCSAHGSSRAKEAERAAHAACIGPSLFRYSPARLPPCGARREPRPRKAHAPAAAALPAAPPG